jgi:glyoxylase-like metal-dependent hydrolase (beta-lactamase superfamily II)
VQSIQREGAGRKADHDPLRRLRSTLVTENGLGIRRADRVQRRRILFDTGNNAKIFEHNVNQLNVDLTRLDAVVISHRHGDHTSGLNHLVRVNPTVKIYAPEEAAYFNGPAPFAFIQRTPGLPPNMTYYRGAQPDDFSLWLAMAGREFRDCPEDHGNFSRLL